MLTQMTKFEARQKMIEKRFRTLKAMLGTGDEPRIRKAIEMMGEPFGTVALWHLAILLTIASTKSAEK